MANDLNLSASQIKTYNLCHRKWFFFKVAGVKEREKQHFVIGHALHGVGERYISGAARSWEGLFHAGWDKGLDASEAMWIRTMTEKAVEKGVWQAVPGSVIEFPIAFLVGDEHVDARGLPLLARAETFLNERGVRTVAKLTCLYDGSPLPAGWDRLPPYVGFIDHLLLWESPPTVADHKTAKNSSYATTPGKLAEDVQVLSYAAVPMVLRPEVDLVRLRHNVFLKNGAADPYVVPATATLEKVRQTWVEIRRTAEDMKLIREIAPQVLDKGPFHRADNWQKVKGAVEEGRARESCNAYGGCPFKDICFGRATADQVISRMDSPDLVPLLKKPITEVKFGLNNKPVPTPHHKEASVPFIKPVLQLYQDCYIIDPDDAGVQFRARVSSFSADRKQAVIALYPNKDIAPKFESLSEKFRIEVPLESLLTMPHPTAKIVSYQDALKAAGVTDGLEWVPSEPVAGAAPVLATTPGTLTRPKADGAFGLKGAPVSAAPATPAAPPVGLSPAPEWAKAVAVGTELVVIQNTDSFWGRLSGKHATVQSISPGDGDAVLLTVVIDGLPYPDVNAVRFEPAPAAPAAPPTPPPPAAEFNPLTPVQQEAVKLRGTIVKIVSKHQPPQNYNCVLDHVDSSGISVLHGQVALSWDEIESIGAVGPGDIPGGKVSKALAAAPAAAPAPAAVPAAADAPAAAPAAPAASATTPSGSPLDQALEAIAAALNGGKVTRKVLEGIKPLLEAAKASQVPGAVAAAPAPVGSADGPRAPDPQLRGIVKVAIEHAMSTLAEAKAKIEA